MQQKALVPYTGTQAVYTHCVEKRDSLPWQPLRAGATVGPIFPTVRLQQLKVTNLHNEPTRNRKIVNYEKMKLHKTEMDFKIRLRFSLLTRKLRATFRNIR